ncbi:hypothetical protein FRA_41c10710 [Francisella sp. W12-1067]|nr:hypothetical protein FRA_41c10710 [Francisella sp. W12-1067]
MQAKTCGYFYENLLNKGIYEKNKKSISMSKDTKKNLSKNVDKRQTELLTNLSTYL